MESVHATRRGFCYCFLPAAARSHSQGTAHLTITPNNPGLRTVYLHASPLLQVNNVTLSSPTPTNPFLPTPASFAVQNPFQPLPVREPPMDLKSHQEIKRKTWAALGERDEGELAISVSHGWVRLLETEGVDGTTGLSLAPIHIQIDYQLVLGGDVVEGIVFRRPGDGGDDSQIPHMFLNPTTFDAARVWTPCVDSLWERCTWELEFVVPRYLEGGEPSGDDNAFPVTVVASGELIEQVTHPHDPHKVIFYYLQTSPATVQHIQFAAGPFEMHQVPAMAGGENQKPMLAFGLPGQMEEMINSTAFLCRAMSFYHTEFGSYPYSAFKMVFVSNPRSPSCVSVTLAILSSDLLHPANIIDQAIDTRQTLSLALIQQWVGVNIIQRTLSDTWLITGLMMYIHGHFIRHLLGNNEYRFRLKKDIDRCVIADTGEQLPLCQPGAIDPPSGATMAFIALKAPLVLHILDRFIAKSGTSAGLSRVIPRILLASLSDELPNNMLSTAYFFRLCRKASGMDLLAFQDQWIYGSGCPHLTIKTNFIRKKFVVEFTVLQSQPALQAVEAVDAKSRDKVMLQKRPTPFFEGSLTVRIHEADGAPFEHLVDIKSNKTFEQLPFNTKYKRTRRSGHVAARFSKLQDVLAQAEDNDDVEAEQLRDMERGEVFAYPPWDDEEERAAWRVHDWSEEEAGAMLGESGGYEWIRVDPDCEWLAHFDIQEKPWFWISQLQGDRDVVAQLQAIQRMTAYPSPVIASELARTVLVENYFYRVRMEAARALVAYNTSEADYMGLFLLVKLFQTFYCYETYDEDPVNAEVYPLPNDFTNIANYFLKKSIVTALAELRDPATRLVWRPVRKLLLNILRGNDNAENPYSDSYYFATVISAVGSAFAAGANLPSAVLSEQDKEIDNQLYREASDANERAMTVDRLVPSYHNVVTQAGLQAQLKSIMVAQRMNDPRIFLSYTREGNYEPLRLMAFDALLLCKPPGRSLSLAQYLFQVIRFDYSLTVRRHVSRAISESILMTLAVGEVYMNITPGVTEQNPDATPEQREKERESERGKIVKAVRKEFDGKTELREIVQSALFDSFTGNDVEIIFALIKAAEVMTRTVPEPKLAVTITLNTPVAETPPASTPKIRFSMGATPTAEKAEPADFPFPRAPTPEPPAPAAPPALKLVINPTKPAKDKKKKQPKAQSRGLPDQDFKAMTLVLEKLVSDKRSRFFRQPVDPIRDSAPNYFAIVKSPMDLQTIRAKLDSGLYSARQEFEADVKLIVSNCLLFNQVGSPVRKEAEAFEKYFKSVWSKTESTLNKANPAAPSPAITIPERPSAGPSSATTLMPPPPLPSATAAPVRIKLKPTKSVTIEEPAPMAPPPVPSKKRNPTPSPPPKPKASKKKREAVVDDDLDDLLGAEVDAMEKPSPDPFDDLLGPPPPLKKIKLNPKPPAAAARATPPPPERFAPQGITIKKIKKVSPDASSSGSERMRTSKSPAEPSSIKFRTGDSASPSASGSGSIKLKMSSDKLKTTADRLKSDAYRPRATSESAPSTSIKLKAPSVERESRDSRDSRDSPNPEKRADKPRSFGDKPSKAYSPRPEKSEKPRSRDGERSSTPSYDRPRSESREPRDPKGKDPAPKTKLSHEAFKEAFKDKPRSTDSSRSSNYDDRDRDRGIRQRSTDSAKAARRVSDAYQPRLSGSISPIKSGSPGPSSYLPPVPAAAPPQPGVPPGYHGYMPPQTSTSRSSAPPSNTSRSSVPPQATPPPAEPVAAALPADLAKLEAPKPPANLPPTSSNTSPFRKHRAKTLLQTLTKEHNAAWFLRPVNPVADGCPTYLDEIRHPSDFHTITRRVDQKKYKTMGAFAHDIELIYANARQFNGLWSEPAAAAAVNEALFWKEWPKCVSSRLTPDERAKLVTLLNKCMKLDIAVPFLTAVDPVLLNIPHYFDIIPPDEARDLSLIRSKLEHNKLNTAKQIDEDVELMLENARVFNGPASGSEVSRMADALGAWWKRQRTQLDL